MPVEAATNCWTTVEDLLAAALPQLATFRTFVGAKLADEAHQRVYWDERDQPREAHAAGREEREQNGSFAIVSSASRQPFLLRRGRDGQWFGNGNLLLTLERHVAKCEWRGQENENASRGQVWRKTKNLVGTIVNELLDYWAENGGPFVRRVVVAGPLENHPESWEDEGRWQLATVVLEWGLTET